jgi:hypothetical protein
MGRDAALFMGGFKTKDLPEEERSLYLTSILRPACARVPPGLRSTP